MRLDNRFRNKSDPKCSLLVHPSCTTVLSILRRYEPMLSVLYQLVDFKFNHLQIKFTPNSVHFEFSSLQNRFALNSVCFKSRTLQIQSASNSIYFKLGPVRSSPVRSGPIGPVRYFFQPSGPVRSGPASQNLETVRSGPVHSPKN